MSSGRRNDDLDDQFVFCSGLALSRLTRDEYEIQFSDVFDRILAYAQGQPMNVVNPPVLKPRDSR